MGTYNLYNNKLEGFQGNTKDVLVVVYDASGNLMDITDYDASLYMKKYPIRPGNPIDVAKSYITKDASAGSFLFKMSSEDLDIAAGDYVYEVIIDNTAQRHTVVQDRFNLKDSII